MVSPGPRSTVGWTLTASVMASAITPAAKTAVSELPINRKGLLPSAHVVGVRSDVGGVRGCAVVAEERGGVTGQGHRVGRRAVGIL